MIHFIIGAIILFVLISILIGIVSAFFAVDKEAEEERKEREREAREHREWRIRDPKGWPESLIARGGCVLPNPIRKEENPK